MVALSVNLNKVALIRNSREGTYPSIVEFAQRCIEAGADGITVHPRPDQRHIRPSDVYNLAEFMKAHSNLEFNIEGNTFAGSVGSYPGFIQLVESTLPHQCTLVPDNDEQLTSDHGFDLKQSGSILEPIIKRLKDNGMRVSLFMDPDPEQIQLAREVGADRIELYTGPYAEAWGTPNQDVIFQQHFAAAECAEQLDLGVNAGHDLNLDNLALFAEIPNLLEVSIGHAMTVDALRIGFDSAVRTYQNILQNR